MRDFLKFALRSREGLATYLVYLFTALGGMFIVCMLMLYICVKDGNITSIDLNIYEFGTAVFSGVFFIMTASRLLKLSVNGGTSRKSYLLGMAVLTPLFAAVTAAAYEAVYLISFFISRLFGIRCECEGMINMYATGQVPSIAYDPMFVLFNMCIVFAQVMAVFALAMIFISVLHRFNIFAAFAAVVLVPILLSNLSYTENGATFIGNISDDMYDGMWAIRSVIEDYPESTLWADGVHMTYFRCLSPFLITAFGSFLIGYLVYFLIMRRTPVRGKQQGGV